MKRTLVLVVSLALVFILAVPLFAQSYDPMKFKSSKPQSAWKIALVPKDATSAWFAAHSIKGAAANAGGARVTEAARRMELLGKSGDLEGVRHLLPELVTRCDEFRLEAIRFGDRDVD